MRQFKKIVFLAALLFLAFWLTFPLVRMLAKLEFSSDAVRTSYKVFTFYAVPFAILLTLLVTVRPQDSLLSKIFTIATTAIITAVVIFFMNLFVLTDTCVWTNKKTFFEHKRNPNKKIMLREFGCGATDSDPPNSETYKVQYFTKYFIKSNKIDTSKINKQKWRKVNH